MAVGTAFPMGILSRNEVRGDGREARRDIGVPVQEEGFARCTGGFPDVVGFLGSCGPAGDAGRVEPASPGLDGSDPPKFCPGSGAGSSRMCTRRPAPFRGVAPVRINPCREGRIMDVSRLMDRPQHLMLGAWSGPLSRAGRRLGKDKSRRRVTLVESQRLSELDFLSPSLIGKIF